MKVRLACRPHNTHQYEPCITGHNVQTTDGTLLEFAGMGSVCIDPIGSLSTFLHVPKLFISLVSVQIIAKTKEI